MLSKYHGGHYRVYNLCCEKAYDPSRFIDGEFVAFPFDDHEVPALPMLFDFVRYASARPCSAAHADLQVHLPFCCRQHVQQVFCILEAYTCQRLASCCACFETCFKFSS
jgi:hypothetical protein